MSHLLRHSEELTFNSRETEKATEAFMLLFGKLILVKGSGKKGSNNAILKSDFQERALVA